MQLMDACVLYKEEDKEKKSFQLLHCWNILRHEPKWHQKMSQMAEIKCSQKKNKAPDDSILDLTGNENDDLPNASNNDIATPEGDAPKLRLEQVRAASEQDWASLKRMIEEERIMTMDTSGMTVQQQRYYESLRSDITTRRGINLT
jgi:hypothetical protein